MRAFVMAALVAAAALPARAEGPGRYAVSGQNSPGGDTYQGSLTLTQTGKETWRLAWAIGDERYEGFGIGTSQILSVMFTSSGKSGVALYVSNDAGGYDGKWAFRGTTTVGTESLTPR